jgi:hypothetical protein
MNQILAQRQAILSVALWNLHALSSFIQSLQLNTIHDMPASFQIPRTSSFTNRPAIRRHIIWAADSVTDKNTQQYKNLYTNILLLLYEPHKFNTLLTNTEHGPHAQHFYFHFHLYKLLLWYLHIVLGFICKSTSQSVPLPQVSESPVYI